MKRNASKKIAVAAGLALMGLTGLFNSAAHAWEDQPGEAPRATQVAGATPIAPAAPALPAPAGAQDNRLIEQTSALAALIGEKYKADPAYNPETDAAVQAQVDGIIATLRAGANGNVFAAPDGQEALGATQLSAFSTGVILATQAGRAELVDAFIAAGAAAKQVAPDTYTPMDYAILDFMTGQAVSRTIAENALQTILRLEAAGARMGDAKNVSFDGGQTKLTIADYNGLAKTFMGRQVLEAAGITLSVTTETLLRGDAEARTDLADEPRLTRAFVERNGGVLVQQEYAEAYPGGPELYPAQPGDTLASIARRFYVVMGERSPLHAVSKLMNFNDLAYDAVLRPGQKIKIPVPATVQVGMMQPPVEATLREIMEEVGSNRSFYIDGASIDDMIRAVARVNAIDEAQALDGTYKHPAGKPLVMLFRNDGYDHLPQLTPPPYADPARRVELVVIEQSAGEEYHQKRTYGVATSSNYAINRNVDFGRFYAWQEHVMNWPVSMTGGGLDTSDALRALMADASNPLRDRLIFTQSMEISIGRPGGPMQKWEMTDQVMQQTTPEHTTIETMRASLRALEEAGPIVFTAAGNQFSNGEGPYKQSFPVVHGPHAYVIGAAGKYNTVINGQQEPAYIMSPYSTAGADICAPLPTYLREQQEGTSFSTPLLAGLFRQMSEWYGDRLSTEEIMAAAMMTANRTVLDYDNPLFVNRSMFPAQFRAHVATFSVNGAGLPFHARCGAGILDTVKWNETLARMVELKAQPDINAAEFSRTVAVGDAVRTPDAQGNGQFVYRVQIPQDMTLGKLTFLMPQYAGEHSDITVRSPSGFEAVMPRALFHAVSSHALAYEDVKAGQFIEIRTDKRLAPGAEVTLRGHTGVNAIARLRDALLADGTLPAPLSTIGGQPAAHPLPAAPTNAVVQDEIAAPEDISNKEEPPAPGTLPNGTVPNGIVPNGGQPFPAPR